MSAFPLASMGGVKVHAMIGNSILKSAGTMNRRTRIAPPEIGVPWTGQSERDWQGRNVRRWIDRDTKLFAIGSCFAENVNRWFIHHGFPLNLPPWGLHYNPATILNEIAVASARDHRDILWEVKASDGQTKFIDAMRHTIIADSSEELDELKNEIKRQARQIYKEANAFLITLGLSEIYEIASDDGMVIINRAPYRNEKSGANFCNRFLTTEEIVIYLRKIVEWLRADKGPDVPIILTVSPVPIKTTSSGLDPRIANVRCKAALLAAVHQFIDSDLSDYPAAYFPGFEIFRGPPEPIGFVQDDLRHPTAFAIDLICRKLIDMFGVPGLIIPVDDSFDVPIRSQRPLK